jgi:uncharacterized protein (TIGR02271 family)
MAKTVVCLVDSAQEAERMVGELIGSCGCDRADIGLMARGEQSELTGGAGTTGDRDSNVASGALKGAGTGAAVGGVLGLVAGVASLAIPGFGAVIAAGPIASALAGAGVGAVAGGIIGGLTQIGVPEDEAHYYAEGVKRGGTLITVHARSDDAADCAAGVMRKHGALDIEERAEKWRKEGWGGRLEGEQVVPVVREDLIVGKKQVSKGAVRVYSHVTEQPVQETVKLREEHANIERRPVDRPVQAGDDAFREQSFEVRETAEEPVVEKKGRVVEEVRVGKQASERKQTVRDTVKKSDVRVEQAGERSSGPATRGYPGPERRKSRGAYGGVERRMAMH